MTPPSGDRSGQGSDCPSAEEIGALLDGTLGPEDRAHLLEHFASCEDCYQVVSGAANFLFENKEAQGGGGPLVPLGSEVRRSRWTLPFAVAAVLTAVLGFSVYRSLDSKPELRSADLIEVDAGSRKIIQLAWMGNAYRSQAGPRVGAYDKPFRLGVQVVNLQAGLEAENQELAAHALQRIQALLEQTIGVADIRASYEEIREGLKARPPAEFLDHASRAETQLEERLNPALFAFGRWTAAGRFAALAQDPEISSRHRTREFAHWLLRQDEAGIAPHARIEVEAIQEVLEHSSLSDADYVELRNRFEAILQIYYPQTSSQSSDLSLDSPGPPTPDLLL